MLVGRRVWQEGVGRLEEIDSDSGGDQEGIESLKKQGQTGIEEV